MILLNKTHDIDYSERKWDDDGMTFINLNTSIANRGIKSKRERDRKRECKNNFFV